MNSNTTLSNEELLQRVYLWLKKKYGDKPVPRFEINTSTLSVLYQLSQLNESRDRDCEVLIEEYKQRTEGYKEEAQRLKTVVTKDIGLQLNENEQSILNSCVQSLASVALVLDLKDTQTSSYLMAVNDLKLKLDMLLVQRSVERKKGVEMVNRTQVVIQKLAELKHVMEQLEERSTIGRQTMNMRRADISYMKSKAAEYQQIVDANPPDALNQTENKQHFTHTELVHKAEELQGLQEMTSELQDKLSSFIDLPPDIALAKIKIEEAKNRLTDVQERLTQRLNGIL